MIKYRNCKSKYKIKNLDINEAYSVMIVLINRKSSFGSTNNLLNICYLKIANLRRIFI